MTDREIAERVVAIAEEVGMPVEDLLRMVEVDARRARSAVPVVSTRKYMLVVRDAAIVECVDVTEGDNDPR